MVAGWPFDNKTQVLLDGVPIPVAGFSANAIMATVPHTMHPGFHNLTVQDSAGRASNALVLNDVDVWWCLGDGASGVEATAGGTVRCYGRGLSSSPAPSTAPDNLRHTLARLSTQRNLAPADLRELLETHSAWLKSADSGPAHIDVTLHLTPTASAVAAPPPIAIQAEAASLSSHSATFKVPSGAIPGDYAVSVSRGGQVSHLNMFLDPSRPSVSSLRIRSRGLPASGHRFNVTSFGPTGLNHTSQYYLPINATQPVLAAIQAAGAAAARTGVAQEVFFPAGVYHVDGPITVPDGVDLVGEGSDLSAVYFSYDNASTAPLALLSPQAPEVRWGLHNLTIYVLSLYKNLVWLPGQNASATAAAGGFHMSGCVVRASAFHCRASVTADINPHRASPWWPGPLSDEYGGQNFAGYQPAIFRLGELVELPSPRNPAPVRTRGLPARNVVVENCDIYGAWNVFQG